MLPCDSRNGLRHTAIRSGIRIVREVEEVTAIAGAKTEGIAGPIHAKPELTTAQPVMAVEPTGNDIVSSFGGAKLVVSSKLPLVMRLA